jgi:hypothetical protein
MRRNRQVLAAMRTLLVFQGVGTSIVMVAVVGQVYSAFHLLMDRDYKHGPFTYDPVHFTFRPGLLFMWIKLLSVTLQIWYAWIPLTFGFEPHVVITSSAVTDGANEARYSLLRSETNASLDEDRANGSLNSFSSNNNNNNNNNSFRSGM